MDCMIALTSVETRRNLLIFLRNGSSIFVFIGLYTIFLLVNKILSWSSSEARQAGKKIKFFIWGFIISFTLWWLLLDLPESTIPAIQPPLVKIAWSFIIFFSALLVFDVFNIMFFDIYYPRVKGTRIPQIISNLIRGIYFLSIVLFIMSTIHGFNIKPFLTGSAILTAIIGLAMQDTLGNLFSGLALHMSRPFDIGHWIKVGEIEGNVVKIEWRATTIRTREKDNITIPNSYLSRVDVINYSTPTKIHGIYIDVGVAYDHPPCTVKKLLRESALMTPGVVQGFEPEIFLVKYNDFSIDYRMRFYMADYKTSPAISSAVMEKIWYVFNRNDVVIPFPIRDVYAKEPKPKFDREAMVGVLSNIDFLQELERNELMDVAKRLKLMLYCKGEEIIRQGAQGDIFYIIKSGTVEVTVRNERGELFLKKKLESDDFFGEISVLTGEPRTATIKSLTDVELLMLNKFDFEILLNKYPDLDERISQKIANRQKFTIEQKELSEHTQSEKEAREKAQQKLDSLAQQILTKIRNFFSLK